MAEKERAERKKIPQCGILAKEPACREGEPWPRDYLLISFVGDPMEGIPAELKLPFGFILFSLQLLHNASIIRCFGKIKNPASAGLI
jgi:hypothetical protein